MPKNNLLHRAASTSVIAATGVLSKLILSTAQSVEVTGRQDFLRVLDERRDGKKRTRGLLTVSNHISVLDDPLMWGTLPLRYLLPPRDVRYALGSHDICFKNPIAGAIFSLGNVLPTYRLHKDPRGGLFQDAMDEAVGMLQGPGYGWMHVFPEGRVHQHEQYQMRYFRWGVSRLILEPTVQPLIVPMFLTGFSDVMHESRGFPRFVPRPGKCLGVHFGDAVAELKFGEVRRAWAGIRERYGGGDGEELSGREAVEVRIETARLVREVVEELRRRVGFPEEDESAGKVETYKRAGMSIKEGRLADGTWEKDA